MSVEVEAVCELVLESAQPQRMREFYERELGLRLLSEEGDRVWLGAGSRCRIGIWSPGAKEHSDRGGRHVHFALAVAAGDLRALCGRLRDRGFEVEGPIEHEGGDSSIYLSDPEGNRVELWDFFVDGQETKG